MSDLLAAARALLDARESQMITRIEWEALERAVADETPPLDEAKVYEGFLEVWSEACLGATKAALAAEGVAVRCAGDHGGSVRAGGRDVD